MKKRTFIFSLAAVAACAANVAYVLSDRKRLLSGIEKRQKLNDDLWKSMSEPDARAMQATAAPEPQIAIGRIVHFVMPSGADRPAIITEDLLGRCIGKNPIALTVFASHEDRQNASNRELYDSIAPTMQKFAVCFDETGQIPGTWHWPKRV